MDSDQVTDAFIRRHGDAIEAGECGPVVRRVHEAYWEYGSDGTPTPKEKATVDPGTAAFIDAVAEKYGRVAPSARNVSSQGGRNLRMRETGARPYRMPRGGGP